MAPLIRCRWAPRRQAPVIRQQTRSHRKVSVIAALCVPPTRDEVRLFFRLHLDANVVDASRTVDFPRQLDRQLDAPFTVIWDRLRTHRPAAVDRFLAGCCRIRSVLLPPYAPELNPAEYLWGHLKMNPLANLAIPDINELADAALSGARSIQNRPDLLDVLRLVQPPAAPVQTGWI